MGKTKNNYEADIRSEKVLAAKNDFVSKMEAKRAWLLAEATRWRDLRDRVKDDPVNQHLYHIYAKNNKELLFMSNYLYGKLKEFKNIRSDLDGDLILRDPQYLDKRFRLLMDPDPEYDPVSDPGLGSTLKETKASSDARNAAKAYYEAEKEMIQAGLLDSNGYPIISGGEAPPKAKPAPKPESKPQTTQPTQTAIKKTAVELDPGLETVDKIIDETQELQKPYEEKKLKSKEEYLGKDPNNWADMTRGQKIAYIFDFFGNLGSDIIDIAKTKYGEDPEKTAKRLKEMRERIAAAGEERNRRWEAYKQSIEDFNDQIRLKNIEVANRQAEMRAAARLEDRNARRDAQTAKDMAEIQARHMNASVNNQIAQQALKALLNQ